MTTSKGCALAIAALAMMLSPLGCGGDDGDTTPAATGKAPVRKAPPRAQPGTAAEPEEVAAEEPQKKPPRENINERRYRRPDEISELPDNFPTDVPVYPESSPTASLVSGEQDFVVSFETADSPSDVLQYYKTGLGNNGWRIESEADLGAQSALVTTKDQRTTTVLVMAGPSETHITITIATE